MNIHALWCHPRSESTAFERIMRERGDVSVLHEPFMYDYYLNRAPALFPDFAPAPDHPSSFDAIEAMILERARDNTVFFKDMAYYVVDELPRRQPFLQAMTHSFLIRDPVESVLSYARRDPGFSLVEVGLEAQHRLYLALLKAGVEPLVITADALREQPRETLSRYWDHAGLPFAEHAFSWDNRVPADWEAVKQWHAAALSSGAIQRPDASLDSAAALAELGPPYTDYAAHHRPFYDALKAVADHQK